MNFFLQEMTYMRYFVPLIIEGNKRNIKSCVYWMRRNKYNCPLINIDKLKKLSEVYNFELKQFSTKHKNIKGTTFHVEGIGASPKVSWGTFDSDQKISLTYMTDYQVGHSLYWDDIDYCIFPSKSFSKMSNIDNDKKSLHLGSPKYDIEFNLDEISKRYSLGKKNALILYPRIEQSSKVDMQKILTALTNLDYKIFIKTRGKDPVDKNKYPNIQVIYDGDWFPHPSLELLYACDVLINFDSTAVKESIMLDTPIINFNVKPKNKGFYKRLPFLLNESCIFHGQRFDITDNLLEIESTDFSQQFKLTREKYLFERKGVCSKILDLI